MDENFGTLFYSDTDFFPLQGLAKLPVSQSTPDNPTNLLKSLYPNRRYKSDTPALNLHQSHPAYIPVSSVNIIPRRSTPLTSFPFSGLTPSQIPLSTPSQQSHPQITTFKLQTSIKTNQIKTSLIAHNHPPAIFNNSPRPTVPTSLTTQFTQPIPIFSSSNPPEAIPMNLPPQHWTIPSTNSLPSSVIN